MSKRALVVIDLQNDYYPGGKWTLHNIETASANARSVLDTVRDSGDLVIHVRHEFAGDDAPFFQAGTSGADIHKDFQPDEGEAVVLKNDVNSFQNTNLKELLDQHSISDLVLVGAMSHMCIDAAARAAADFGYNVTVIEDACAARDLEFNGQTVAADDVHSAYMSALGFAYANVLTTAQWQEL